MNAFRKLFPNARIFASFFVCFEMKCISIGGANDGASLPVQPGNAINRQHHSNRQTCSGEHGTCARANPPNTIDRPLFAFIRFLFGRFSPNRETSARQGRLNAKFLLNKLPVAQPINRIDNNVGFTFQSFSPFPTERRFVSHCGRFAGPGSSRLRQKRRLNHLKHLPLPISMLENDIWFAYSVLHCTRTVKWADGGDGFGREAPMNSLRF